MGSMGDGQGPSSRPITAKLTWPSRLLKRQQSSDRYLKPEGESAIRAGGKSLLRNGLVFEGDFRVHAPTHF